MKRILNPQHISSITVHLKKKETWYVYEEEIKILFFKFGKTGFYNLISGKYAPNENIEKDVNLYIEGKDVFFHPHLKIKMTNGDSFCKFFKSEDELKNFLNTKLSYINLIAQDTY